MPDDVSRCWIARHPVLTGIVAVATLWQAREWGVRHAGEDYEPQIQELRAALIQRNREMREAVDRCHAERQAERDEIERQAAEQLAAAQSALAVAEDQARTQRTLVQYRTKIVRVAADDAITAGGDCRLPDDWMHAANAFVGASSGGAD